MSWRGHTAPDRTDAVKDEGEDRTEKKYEEGGVEAREGRREAAGGGVEGNMDEDEEELEVEAGEGPER
jgi:hypothetical protein